MVATSWTSVLAGGCLGVAEAQLHFFERKSSVSSSCSSSSVPASLWSSAFVVLLVLSCVVPWVVVVVVMFVGRFPFFYWYSPGSGNCLLV